MEGLGINFNLILQQVIVFLVFYYLFNKFLLQKLLQIVEKREDKIKEGLDYAEKMQQEYQKLEDKTAEELEKARKKATEIIEETKLASAKIGEEIKEKAKSDAEEIIERAKIQLEKDRIELRNNVKNDVAKILESALSKIALEATEESKRKSIEQAIKEL